MYVHAFLPPFSNGLLATSIQFGCSVKNSAVMFTYAHVRTHTMAARTSYEISSQEKSKQNRTKNAEYKFKPYKNNIVSFERNSVRIKLIYTVRYSNETENSTFPSMI